MEPMSRVRKVVFWHLVGLMVVLGLTASYLAVWNVDCAAWSYCTIAALSTGAITLFVRLTG